VRPISDRCGQATFGGLAFSPCAHCEGLLAGVEARTGWAHVYSVAAEHIDGGVPRRSAALMSIAPPPEWGGVASPLQHVVIVAGGGKRQQREDTGGALAVVVSHGDGMAAYQLPVGQWFGE
jgi:hypothetical protein